MGKIPVFGRHSLKFICQNKFYFKLFNLVHNTISDIPPKFKQYCFQNFVDHKRCVELKGEDFAPCDWFKNAFMAACPQFWVEGFDTAIEKGAFQVKGAAFNS